MSFCEGCFIGVVLAVCEVLARIVSATHIPVSVDSCRRRPPVSGAWSASASPFLAIMFVLRSLTHWSDRLTWAAVTGTRRSRRELPLRDPFADRSDSGACLVAAELGCACDANTNADEPHGQADAVTQRSRSKAKYERWHSPHRVTSVEMPCDS